MRRAQAAMEYLMTYGWAILVVLIALGALFYLGIFSPSTPSTCSVPAPISCTDIKITSADQGPFEIVLGATGTSSATLDSVSVTSPSTGSCAPAATISKASPASITCNTLAAGSGYATGSRFTGTGTITYQLEGSTTSHTTTVDFSGTVE